MAKRLLITVRTEAVRAYLNGKTELRIFGITIHISTRTATSIKSSARRFGNLPHH